MPAALRNILNGLAEPTYAILRIVTGLLFMQHGIAKLFSADPVPTLSKYWVAGVIELVTGVMLALGVQARLAAFLAAGTMAVAYWTAHFSMDKPLPSDNGGLPAVLYCWLFLIFATRGPGRFTLWPKGDAA